MPLNAKGQKILHSMENTYGSEKAAKSVLYASKNAGRITGIDGTRDAYAPGMSQVSELNKEQVNQNAANTLGKGKSSTSDRRRRKAAFRDALRRGLSFDKALALVTKDEGEPIEGAMEVFRSVAELHNKVTEGFGEHGGEHSEGGHNVHGQAHGAPAASHGVAAPKTPAVHSPKAPGVTAPKTVGTSSQPPKGQSLSGTIMNPPGSRPAGHSHDAAARFRIAVRDAVRENQPLPRVIELGVISGTSSNGSTPQSEGKEWKPPTKDAFSRNFRDAIGKGATTTDALKAALRR